MRHTFSLIVLFLVVTLMSFAAAWQVQIAWGADGGGQKKEVRIMDTQKKVMKSEDEWKKELTPEQYRILRQAGTERAFTGALNDVYDPGLYRCGACGAPLFRSDTKYDHGSGWPSFTEPITAGAIEYRDDNTYGMERVEVRCAACGSHLGHVFDDGPGANGKHFCINSASMKFEKATQATGPQKATFAAGCFWGVELKLSQVSGVLSTRVGYTGGHTKSPTYEEVCTDGTGHAEAVEVTYDPTKVSYEKLLDTFFSLHDPTQIDRQGPDVGAQYRSAVFYHSAAQELAATAMVKKLNGSGKFRRPIATQIAPATDFYPAEEYHQKYYQKRGKQGCGI